MAAGTRCFICFGPWLSDGTSIACLPSKPVRIWCSETDYCCKHDQDDKIKKYVEANEQKKYSKDSGHINVYTMSGYVTVTKFSHIFKELKKRGHHRPNEPITNIKANNAICGLNISCSLISAIKHYCYYCRCIGIFEMTRL